MCKNEEEIKREYDLLQISDERIEELMNIASEMMDNCTEHVDDNTCGLDVSKLVIECENRKDITEREKILCAIQMGIGAGRMIGKNKYSKELMERLDYIN